MAIILFLGASVLSYVSMRTDGKKSDVYEKAADLVFLAGLVFIAAVSILTSFETL